MIPWHRINYTPEQRAEIAERLRRMHERLDMPIEVVETADGFIVRRDGNTGCGKTEEEALRELFDKENKDTIYPPF